MAWPTGTINTSNTDQGTDNPRLMRLDLLAMMQLVQLMLNERPMLQDGGLVFAGTAGGSANALTGTLVPAPTQLINGMHIFMYAAAPNTAAATLNVNGLGARPITKRGGAALIAGNISAAGAVLLLCYHAAGARWELLNPYEPGLTGIAAGTYTAPTIVIDAQGRITQMQSGSTGFAAAVVFANPGSFNWVVPAGVSKVHAKVWGGGGSGGASGLFSGGAGGYAEGYFAVSPGQSIQITVGAGGAGVAASFGNAGGSSSFGAYCSASGGARGGGNNAAGGNGFGGHINLAGAVGTVQQGGSAPFGGAGGLAGVNLFHQMEAADPAPEGKLGQFPGGGGGKGGYFRDDNNRIEYMPSGPGASGCVLIEY